MRQSKRMEKKIVVLELIIEQEYLRVDQKC